MKCPKCGGRYLEIHGSFAGSQKIEFKDADDFTVVDSKPTDFEWDDHDMVECLDCGHSDSALQFEEAEEEDEPEDNSETETEESDEVAI